MKTYDLRTYANSFLVFLFVLAHGFFSNDLGFWKNAAHAAIMASVLLISCTLFLGPLSRIFPKRFANSLIYRKPLGISGFALSFVYFAILFAIINRFEFMAFFNGPNYFSNIYFLLGLLTLIALYAISHPKEISQISFTRWKSLQVLGYAALAFLLLHFGTVDSGFFLNTYSGKTVLLFGILAIAAKIIAVALGFRKTHSEEEIRHITRH